MTCKEAIGELRKIWDLLEATDYEEMRNFWWVLTALRGPDVENEELKGRTTEVIRREVLPGAERVGAYVASASRSLRPGCQKKPTWHMDHFCKHVVLAAEALEIPILWEKEEDEKGAKDGPSNSGAA